MSLSPNRDLSSQVWKATKAAAKEIGRTTYIVLVHFSKTSKENMSDKIKRMLKNEIQQM